MPWAEWSPFTNLILNQQATGYTLQLTSPGQPAVVTTPFNVAINPPTQVVFHQPAGQQPPRRPAHVGHRHGRGCAGQPGAELQGPVTLLLGSSPVAVTLTAGVGSATVTSGGSGYLAAPTVTVLGGRSGRHGDGNGQRRCAHRHHDQHGRH